ncbi:MAG: class I SAM-dependent methyltransferase [Streptosporangiales bacterium]|nr:class I SAM-dependent methyltransferase [Streptosporangiales bacterium]
MLTVDFRKFPIYPGERVLDIGCGAGRHAYELYRRGAQVVAADLNGDELGPVNGMFAAMKAEEDIPSQAGAQAVSADMTNMPFPDNSFDKVIASEILEHVPNDRQAMAEIARVLRPGGVASITVPSWFPERICWALSDDYHNNPGGHIRIFTKDELAGKLTASGLTVTGSHHAHALHSPYWWLKCAAGVANDKNLAVRGWHQLLVWDIMRAPAATRLTEKALNPVIGKSLVMYVVKHAD